MSLHEEQVEHEQRFMQYNASNDLRDIGYIDVDTVVAIRPESYGCLIELCTPPHTIRSYYIVKTQMMYMRHAMTLDEIYDAHCGEVIPDGHLD